MGVCAKANPGFHPICANLKVQLSGILRRSQYRAEVHMQTGKGVGEAQMQALGEDWRIIESLLPAGWMEMARELGALRRTRGFADARALLRVMLIHLADGCGLRDTAVRAAQAGRARRFHPALRQALEA